MSATKRFLGLVLSCAVVTFTGACGGDDAPADPHTDHDGGHPDGHVDDASDDTEPVPCTAAYPAFREGLTAKAGELTIRLLSVDPEPPRQKMDNTWVLEVVDASGAPVPGAVIEDVDTYMDVHKHGGRWEPTISPGTAAGRFALTRVDFKMPGPWRLRFAVRPSAGGTAVRTNFPICVE